MGAGTRIAAALVLAAAWAGGALAQPVSPMFSARGGAVRSLTPEQKQERFFLREAAAHLRFEREASKLALARSTDDKVRQVAGQLLEHADSTQPEVLYLLHARAMAMPLVGNDEARVLRELRKSAGRKFDRVYLQEVALKANQAAAAHYERIAAVTRDPELRAWVARHLPTVRYHASLASRAAGGGAGQLVSRAGSP